MFRFVHLSDIHFGQELKAGTIHIHDDARNELLLDVRQQCRLHGNADGILIIGDSAYSGKRDEYVRAAKWLDDLAEAAGCSKTAVLLIPGNHDVDLDEIDHFGKAVHELLRIDPLPEVEVKLKEYGEIDINSHPLHKKLRAYREFAEQYGCDFDSSSRPYWSRDFTKNGQHILRFVGLNSVQVSNEEDDKAKMVLGSSQFTVQRQPEVEYIILLHHPFEWYRDREEAERFLTSRAKVLVFGHEHIASIDKTTRGDNHEYLMIDSGATNPPDELDKFRFSYNWLNFSVRENNGFHALALKVYPRVWTKTGTKFVAASERMVLDTDGSKEIVLGCTQFGPVVRGLTTASPKLPAPDATVNPPAPPPPSRDDSFDKLRLLFWRHLDWRQRITVLVNAKVLPDTPSIPVPQTLERMALDRAKGLGRLEQIWDETMKFVPADQKEPNPFVTT